MGIEYTFIGLLLSLVFIGLTGYNPGGIIVPGYLVFFVDQPMRIIGTFLAAILALLCYRVISRYLILFGRRRFVFMIFFGGLWAFLWLMVFPEVAPAAYDFRVIGWVMPGLVANSYERQGVLVTTAGLITVTVVAYLVGRLISMLLQ